MNKSTIKVCCLLLVAFQAFPISAKKIILQPSNQPKPRPTHEIPVDADFDGKNLFVDFGELKEVAQVSIKDNNGVVLLDMVDTQASPRHVINTEDLAEGEYTLEVEYQDCVVEGDFTVEE